MLFLLIFLLSFGFGVERLSNLNTVLRVEQNVNVNRLRLICLTISALAASATVAFTGVIGFIGLASPHICRMLIGSDNRFLIPCSCLMGAALLLVSDTLARTIIAPTEIPVGIITSLIGAPFFLYLLLKKRKRWW